MAGGLNLYGFAGGDPVNFSDPFGLCPDGPEPCPGSGAFFAAVAQQTGGTLEPWQGPIETTASVLLSGPMGGGEMAIARLGLSARVAARGVQANRAVGLAAERAAVPWLEGQGYRVVGSHVAARTSGGRRVIDHLVQGTVVCVAAGGAAGAWAGAKLGAFLGSALDVGVMLAKMLDEAGGGPDIPGRPFRGPNAAEDAFKHLEKYHGVDPTPRRTDHERR